MLEKFLVAISAAFLSSAAVAQTIIAIQSPYNPSHSGTPAMLKIIDEANRSQNDFRFILEFRPGGNQILAVKQMDQDPQSRLAIIAPAFVENVDAGQIRQEDYVPVHALGNACWAVITNIGDEARGVASLRGVEELVVGGVGIGNAAHLTALMLGERLGFRVRYVVFRSNNDAVINMVGNNGVNFAIDRVESYENFKSKNPNLRILAASCPQRIESMSRVRTLREQGFNAPYIFNITIASAKMDAARRARIEQILEAATRGLGEREVYALSGMRPPYFDRIGLEEFAQGSFRQIRDLQRRYQAEIQAQR